ncbi:protein DpdE [Acinetobacter sp. YH16052]|uniref:protein DpdE n=1 Tax=Acinetobacter sp. YH16052 TaxID=2601191 RepID=UPI0015D3E71A
MDIIVKKFNVQTLKIRIGGCVLLGDLVVSTKFLGVGKVIQMNNETCEVAFFNSPRQPYANVQICEITDLKKYTLYAEQVVYVLYKDGYWQRARYIGEYQNHQHLLMLRQDERLIANFADIFVLNTHEEWINPIDFLSVQANDAPFFYPLREKFIAAYTRQRASCCSMGAILSSSIELEAHQLAVVKRVMQDPIQKYLLADEVGLGKTIETGILIRHHVLNLQKQAQVLVIVPDGLAQQWQNELALRFHLEDVMPSDENDNPQVQVLGYQEFCKTKKMSAKTMIVVDEMHHVAAWAWGESLTQNLAYHRLVHACEQAQSVLLLSGTPLNGNEKNFLAMLHCLSPKHYQLDGKGIQNFKKSIEQSEWLGGIRGALSVENDNMNIERILDELSPHFLEDMQLHHLISELRPLVDLFDGREIEDEERQQVIQALNQYIGEHYRLYERMLRNRRDSKELSVLFPGLAGARQFQWSIASSQLSLEQLMLEYLALRYPSDEQQHFAWFKDLMVSPQMIIQRCSQELDDATEDEEKFSLQEIIAQAKIEQKAKDQLLIEMIYQALAQSPILKLIVFVEDQALSQEVYQLLTDKFGDCIEHNAADEHLKFNEDQNDIRILVCDANGEDGLNLQGAERLVIHYAMTHSISRLEQRLGRVNRYSANVKGIQPIESWLIVPTYSGIFDSWVSVLIHSVGIFNRTMASLQYVLEEQFALTWKDSVQHGMQSFERLQQKLGNHQQADAESFIEIELKKVRFQEELMRMDDQVKLAEAFAKSVSQSDDTAEEDAQLLLGWILEALKFKKYRVNAQQFRLGFVSDSHVKEGGRTLLDIDRFLKNCLMGMDYNEALKTHIMSPSRRFLTTEEGSVYPLRYGQPFVDSIFNLLKQDARGATSAILRIFKKHKLPHPQIFFQSTWLVSHSAENLVVADELFAPRIEKIWLDFKGNVVSEQHPLYKFLFVAYDNVRLKDWLDEASLRPDVWDAVKTKISLTQWQNWVETTSERAESILREKYVVEGLKFTLVSIQSHIYLSPEQM